jgi:hypothetical protein
MNNAFLELLDGSSLYSDRTTREGTFSGKQEFGTNFNKLISPNKKAIAILQQDGNFAIRLGNFNAAGEPKRPDGSFENDPFKYPQYTQEVWSLFGLTGFNLPNIGLTNAPFELVFNAQEGFYIRSLKAGLVYKFNVGGLKYTPYGEPFKLYLKDDGDLRIDKGNTNIWSTKFAATLPPEEPKNNTGPTNQQAQEAAAAAAAAAAAQNQPITNVLSSPILLIAAAAAAFLYLRK